MSTRLIVKNLPKHVTDKRLKELFSQKGTVTDLQLKYTEDGKFRRFCFVGYKTEDQAVTAKQYFHNSCIDSSRITVEFCAALGDPSKPKSWSKYAKDSTIHKSEETNEVLVKDKKKKKKDTNSEEVENVEKGEKKKKKKKKKDEENDEVQKLLEKHKSDPMFSHFLETHAKDETEIMKLNNKLNTVKKEESEDETSESDESENEETGKSVEEEKLLNKNISDKEFMEMMKNKSKPKTDTSVDASKGHGSKTFFTVKLKGLGYNHKKKDIKIFFKGIKAKSIRVPQKIKGIAFVGFKTEKQMKMALNKNKSFLDGKCIYVTKYENVEKNEEKSTGKQNNLRWKQQEDTLKSEENVGESGKIFLRNLSYETTEDDIRQLFEKYGPLTEVNLPVDIYSRKRKGFGTVTFLMPEHAVKAYTELDGTAQNGRMLHLLPAKTKHLEEPDLDGLSFKQKKALKEKLTAGSSHNWNSLFLGHNAVADAIAKTYNTTKEKVLSDEGNTTAAVRLALGETQIVQETQKFLEENGVKLNAFNQAPKKRSQTVILVKDLPAGTRADEIRDMFSKFGPLGRVLLPPSGITALVEYLEPSEARKGFKNLAYKRFKHLPLYLEWAPDDSLAPLPADYVYKKEESNNTEDNSKTKKGADKKEKLVNGKEEKVEDKKEESEEEEEEEEEEPEPDTTLYVKNLNFKTTDEKLKKFFSKCGKIHYANVSTKKDPNDSSNKLSMGFGFVRYKYKADAERALKELQTSTLDGKTLELKRSDRTTQSDIQQKTVKKTSKITEQTGTKILVRNIPFQADANEIKDLFKPFGEIKSVRLPKKLVGEEKHRGFGFVEFYTKKQAKAAFKALVLSTHLYGRRLVLEWAQLEEGVEDLRKRTAKHFHQEEAETKRSKKGTLNPENIGLEEV